MRNWETFKFFFLLKNKLTFSINSFCSNFIGKIFVILEVAAVSIYCDLQYIFFEGVVYKWCRVFKLSKISQILSRKFFLGTHCSLNLIIDNNQKIIAGSKHIDKGIQYTFLHPFLGKGLLVSRGKKSLHANF